MRKLFSSCKLSIGTDAHNDAVIDLSHGDTVTLAGTTAAQLQAILQNAVHLH